MGQISAFWLFKNMQEGNEGKLSPLHGNSTATSRFSSAFHPRLLHYRFRILRTLLLSSAPRKWSFSAGVFAAWRRNMLQKHFHFWVLSNWARRWGDILLTNTQTWVNPFSVGCTVTEVGYGGNIFKSCWTTAQNQKPESLQRVIIMRHKNPH